MLQHNEQSGTLAYETSASIKKQAATRQRAQQRQPQQRTRKSLDLDGPDPFEIMAAMEVSRDKVRLANNRTQQRSASSTKTQKKPATTAESNS